MTRTTSQYQDDRSQIHSQVYKGHLIVPRYSRSWWWVTVIDPYGNELKTNGFATAEGQPSLEAALAYAKQAIDTQKR
ncbi:hypothetical protein [Baaleninema simplex]|uniref:hypothetical protein n=1 Tax=Baaleninema simplex TaxID=2862350 RepID=UPI0011818434|nr:hypothetical protein [Baaleninema simplex]